MSTTATAPPADTTTPSPDTVRERLRNRSRPTLTLTICDDHQAQQALAEARMEEQRLTATVERNPDDAGVKAALAKARQRTTRAQRAVDEASIRLRFQALDRRTYLELRAAHPPTEEQADEGYDFNLDTLGPVIIAASSLDGITEDDARTYLDEWSQAEAEALLNTAFGVQREERMDLGKG